jgi:hypothetical protein
MKRPGIAWFALIAMSVGLAGLVVAFCVWTLAPRADRALAIAVGGFGFAALCFGNAASSILRSVRLAAARRQG